MKRNVLLIFALVFFCENGFATDQVFDSITVDGKGYYIMHKFLNEEILSEYAMPYIDLENFYPSTALHRGYVAEFSISQSKLTLKEINLVRTETTERGIAKDKKFGISTPEILNKINSILITDVLILIDNNGTYGSTSGEKPYKVVELKNSYVTKEKDLTEEEFERFKDEQFEKFKLIKDFKKEYKKVHKSYKNLFSEGYYGESYDKEQIEEKALNSIKNYFLFEEFYKNIII